MAMTAAQREATVSSWIKPSSENEKAQQDRAERMVRDAIAKDAVLSATNLKIYTKGSYPNNTNVRQDSDVDVVVELHECMFTDFAPGVVPSSFLQGPGPYTGTWNAAKWRSSVLSALRTAFDTEDQKHVTPGKIAINVNAVANSRPSIDIVPSFLYYRYDSPDRSIKHEGSCVFSTAGEKVVNWPNQQLLNGQTKNRTTSRYKAYVRALKNAENVLAKAGTIELLPSYFMECLAYNVPNLTLQYGSLTQGFGQTLGWMYQEIANGNAYNNWIEPNELKWLFKGTQKWSVDDAKGLIEATWSYLGYGGN